MTSTHVANLVIRTAGPGDTAACVSVLTAAFTDNGVSRWAEPDPHTRHTQLRFYFTALLEHAHTHGTIRVAHPPTEPVTGVAVWYTHPLPPGTPDVHHLLDPLDLPLSPAARRLARLDEALAARQPADRPHHYLAWIGVTPARQNHGVGTSLITGPPTGPGEPGRGVFLEANDPRNHDLYQRLGYTDLGPPVTVDGCPPVWPMWHP
ncbi:GNAT family N-acetyltransferase [Mangrovihabitans endophyticus]|uniref:N-acetyltransferase n=1 Tax=Mangrovihabitans endophyticus TaxID=1751298 RepID=A0A8J3C6P3_9ACTN|nr:GNAT family N-acetyltransferase [Mangrovihabitans endophyticus]GGL21149.1 N-acetyltransferase [Mangrovihabitans endophyticus]